MSMDLNLLPSQAKFQAAKMRLKEKINKGLIIGGGVWVLVLLIVFGFWFAARFRLEAKEKEYKRVLDSYKSMEESVFISEQLKHRAKIVGQVLDRRFEYGKALTDISNLFSSQVIIDKYELNEGRGFTVIAKAFRSEGLDEVEKKAELINKGLVEGFSRAELKTLKLSHNTWEFELDVKTQ